MDDPQKRGPTITHEGSDTLGPGPPELKKGLHGFNKIGISEQYLVLGLCNNAILTPENIANQKL